MRERERERERERSHSESFASVRAVTEHLTDPHFRGTPEREQLQYGFATPAQVRRADGVVGALRVLRRRLASHRSHPHARASDSLSVAQASRARDPARAARQTRRRVAGDRTGGHLRRRVGVRFPVTGAGRCPDDLRSNLPRNLLQFKISSVHTNSKLSLFQTFQNII